MSSESAETREWLEADGLGGFASGTVSMIRSRRYHALLQVATTPPTGRMVLVAGVDAWIEDADGRSIGLGAQRWQDGTIHPRGFDRLVEFRAEPWPLWRLEIGDGRIVEFEVMVPKGLPAVSLSWRVIGDATGVKLRVRPLLACRDHHHLERERSDLSLKTRLEGGDCLWNLDSRGPVVRAASNGEFRTDPVWYRGALLDEERARGFDAVEDLASPGWFEFGDLEGGAALVFDARGPGGSPDLDGNVADRQDRWRRRELERRGAFPDRLARAADAYLVRRGTGRTIIAGYPWFTDWGRDTFIALRGLCLATGRLDDALAILSEWADLVQDGMVPNRLPDVGSEPEYNSADASLWYVIAARETLSALEASGHPAPPARVRSIRRACERILAGYAAGTRHGIRLDEDGLLAAGEPGLQLTWMDAKVGDHVITPRIGKPVELQALWLNALHLSRDESPRWAELLAKGLAAFRARFPSPEKGGLLDVVDAERVPGCVDDAIRPNQILAAGGLPLALVEGERLREVVDLVEQRLFTPMGLRSLAPGEPGYCGYYRGGPAVRDAAYHQGTVWPWLTGAFVEAWLRAHGDDPEHRREARSRFVEPLIESLDRDGIGHVSEIADAEAPHVGRGCPFQAWSLGELIRACRMTDVDGD